MKNRSVPHPSTFHHFTPCFSDQSGSQHATTFCVEACGWHLVARPALFPLDSTLNHSSHRSCWHLRVLHHKLQIWALGRHIHHIPFPIWVQSFCTSFLRSGGLIQLARDSGWPILGQGWAMCVRVQSAFSSARPHPSKDDWLFVWKCRNLLLFFFFSESWPCIESLWTGYVHCLYGGMSLGLGKFSAPSSPATLETTLETSLNHICGLDEESLWLCFVHLVISCHQLALDGTGISDITKTQCTRFCSIHPY